MTVPLLGCIADDVTGATDLALNLTQGGMRVVQWLGIPSAGGLAGVDADAIVVALKTRSIPAADAVAQSLAGLERLRERGCRRFYFKYCSTFDSTPDGNIGPVTEALRNALEVDQAILCPAFPEAGRTLYSGHLFVHGVPLDESSMRDHPLTPMRDANLPRVLAQQSRRTVGLVPYRDVSAGPDAIRRRRTGLRAEGVALVLVDALDETHLKQIAAASADDVLVTGGSGLARFLPPVYRAGGLLDGESVAPKLPDVPGRAAILAGSCSSATRGQVAEGCRRYPSRDIDVAPLVQDPEAAFREAMAWVDRQPAGQPLLIYSTAEPAQVAAVQERFGRDLVAAEIERLMARIARALVESHGVRRLIVAGGETASAVAEGLGIEALRIGPEIAPGVPWTETLGPRPLALAFKSGNFGNADFFHTALEMLS